MKNTVSYAASALLLASQTLAFTNGTLVPSYLCNPKPDGLPKAFGQVLSFTREKTPVVAFSQNAGQNVKAPQLAQTGANSVGNSAYILASLHDSPNSITTKQNSLKIQLAKGQTIVAGQANAFTVITADNSQLKGAVLVGQDSTGTRQGSFTDVNGGPFIPFQGCGANPQGKISGVIQQTGVSATSSYSKLVWNAPACIPGNNITFGGLSVTSSGFGQWTQSFQVTGSSCGGNTGAATGGNTGSNTGSNNAGAGSNAGAGKSSAAAGAQKGAQTATAATSAAAGTQSSAGAAQQQTCTTKQAAKASASAQGAAAGAGGNNQGAGAQKAQASTMVTSVRTRACSSKRAQASA